MSPRSRHLVRRAGGAITAALLSLIVPAIALAHPLGNFTINHFAALRISPNAISLDVVIDRAEIPAFQESQRLDLDRDGVLGAAELEQERLAACPVLAADLRLAIDGKDLVLRPVAAGLSLPPGAAGLPTMRLVCGYESSLAAPMTTNGALSFEDRSFAERIGWREIVVIGDGTTVIGGGSTAGGSGVSNRLTSYPTDLLARPLDVRSIAVSFAPGGPVLAPWIPPDARRLGGTAEPGLAPGFGPASEPVVAAVPGGVAADLAALVDVTDLTPLAILGSLAVAFALGVIHAISPGHGKTIMAAYLVGTKGSSRQAVGLGLAVTASHTLGVLALAGITLAASSVLPPERLYPILGVVSGTLVIAIGATLLWSRLRTVDFLGSRLGHHHGNDHGHGLPRPQLHLHPHDHAASEHGHPDPHPHPHPHPHAAPEAGAGVSWKGLIALGLTGGLVPSASALILLLGSIAAGRVAYGVVLVVGFGVGMAVVLAGIGLVIVNARRLLDRRPSAVRLQRMVIPVQLATASLVVVLGIVLTGQALTQVL